MSKQGKDCAYLTDEYIRGQATITTKEAAKYLGMSWWALTGMLQQGKAPFGMARLCSGGTWSYTIWGERLYRFKHCLDEDPAAAIIAQKLTEVIKLLNEWKGGAA